MKKFCFTLLITICLWLSIGATSNAGVHVGVYVGAPGPVYYPEPAYYGPYYGGGYYPRYYHGRHYYGHYGHYGHHWR